MPCNMYDGATSGDFAQSDAREALRRIAEIEQALCGLCQMIANVPNAVSMHPQLQAWFQKHQSKPGCEAGKQTNAEHKCAKCEKPIQAGRHCSPECASR